MRCVLLALALLSPQAFSHCDSATLVGSVEYANNSSYFSSNAAKMLDKLAKHYSETASTQSGYLLLEFHVNREQESAKIRDYNLWLAQRRIERVKTYLTTANYGAPMISRILTASNEDSREVTLSWCTQTIDDNNQVASSDNSPVITNSALMPQ